MHGVSTAEQSDEEPRLHLFTIDDPRLWEFRSALSDEISPSPT